MFRHSLLAATVVMSLAGCAAMDAPGRSAMPGSPPEAFAHRVATAEVVLLWNCLQPEAGLLRLEGVAQSPWAAQPIRFLEFELVGVDAQGRMTAQTAGAARDVQLFTNQSTPFRLDLKTTGTEVRFDLYYQYRFLESVEVTVLLAGPRLLVQTSTFLARDVCADTQHRAR